MNISYYSKLYQLNQEDTVTFGAMSVIPDHAKDIVETLAQRWIGEARARCTSEVHCRAVIFRGVVESGREAGMPEILTIAWAHLITDRVAEQVSEIDEQNLWS